MWKTLETKHFRITYYNQEEDIARHLAGVAEATYDRLVPSLGSAPSERTEIVLTDFSDSANGSATALPFNRVALYVTAPDDLSPLGDVDDWYLELFTHEFTHIIHTDTIRGIPSLLNRLMGKTFAPNQVQPRWVLEGLAVFEESRHTSGGRLRSSQWNMYMRADVLSGNVAPIDQMSNTPRRWPQGNIWYLYGSFFLRYIAETYGEDAIARMIADYGSQLIPYGFNRSIRRATGKTFEELYPAWIGALRRQYDAQASEIRARGLREGVRLTTGGQIAQKPRFIPKGAWTGHAGEVLYFRDDGHDTGGLWRVPLTRDARGVVIGAREDQRELMIRTSGVSTPSFLPDGGVLFSSVDVHNNLFSFYDLFRMAPGAVGTRGIEGNRTRLTDGWRADGPDVSPDGRRVVFASNHRGTTQLQIADLSEDGVTGARPLVRGEARGQAFAPRWAPDGQHVAYSAWERGGYRDIRYVDVKTGEVVRVTRDRAVDGGPTFGPDGTLYFHSDRTGVMNVYAWDPRTGRLRQVTNVVNGAYQPEISPDGKTLLYVGYTSAGFDLYAMALDESRFLEALPYADDRPPMPSVYAPSTAPARAYNPLETLRPRRYQLQIQPGTFGQASILTVAGDDIASHHSFVGTLTTEWERPEVQGSLAYSYERLPFDVGLRAFRSVAARTGYQLGANYKPVWAEEQVGGEVSLSYSLPRAFDGQSVALSYSYTRLGGDIPRPVDRLDPHETPSIPRLGMLASLHAGWSYSNVERYLWSVGGEKGFSVGANVDVADPWLAGDFSGVAATFSLAGYVRMPWRHHHTLGLRMAGGTGTGNLGGRGLFYVGGFMDLPIVDTVRNVLIQGGSGLRGYPPVALAGRNFALFNAEYRFPILNLDRGLSTLPIFLNRVSGAAFVDYGSAFDDPTTAKFKTGVGGEAWLDLTLGYFIQFTFRLGYAKGLASGGLDKTYFVAAVPF